MEQTNEMSKARRDLTASKNWVVVSEALIYSTWVKSLWQSENKLQ